MERKLTPTDAQFWDRLMPVIGPLNPRQRTLAVAHVIDAVRGQDVGEAMVGRLIEELRQRFGGGVEGETTCH